MSTASAAKTEQTTGPEALSGHAPTPAQPTKAKRRRRRRAKGLGSVYRRAGAQTWTVAWTQHGVQHSEHGFPDEETAERFRKLKVVDVAEGRDPRMKKKHTGTLNDLAQAWLKVRRGAKAAGDKPAVAGTHRSGDQDSYRWKNHLHAAIGHLAPDDLDVGKLKAFVSLKLGEGLSPASVRLLVRLVSTFYSDLVDEGKARTNPAKLLPKKTRALLKPSYDPKKTPFVEKLEDVANIFKALPEPSNIAYAVSALGGLRPGEVRALRWANVDLDRRQIYVCESVEGPTKDKDARHVPMSSSLHALLSQWRKTNPETHLDLVCPPMRGGSRRHLDEHTLGKQIRKALQTLKIGPFKKPFYQAGRHTYASHYVLGGGSIEKLREILGHSTVLVTERYSHHRPDLFSEADRERVSVALAS